MSDFVQRQVDGSIHDPGMAVVQTIEGDDLFGRIVQEMNRQVDCFNFFRIANSTPQLE